MIEPRMVGRLLDHDIAGFEVNRLVVEHHIDFARHNYRIVDGARAVQQRIGHRNAAGQCAMAGEFHHRLGWLFRAVPGAERRDVDDTEYLAVGGRQGTNTRCGRGFTSSQPYRHQATQDGLHTVCNSKARATQYLRVNILVPLYDINALAPVMNSSADKPENARYYRALRLDLGGCVVPAGAGGTVHSIGSRLPASTDLART